MCSQANDATRLGHRQSSVYVNPVSTHRVVHSQQSSTVTRAENFGNVAEPGGDLRITLDACLTEEQTQQLRRGTIHLWAWRYVAYRTYLDQHMVKGFIGVLDAHPTRRLLDAEDEQDREDESDRHYRQEI